MRLLQVLCCLIVLLAAGSAYAIKAKDLPVEKEKALAGNSLSQVNVGDYYYARNEYAASLEWYWMAAAQGRIDARQRLAFIVI